MRGLVVSHQAAPALADRDAEQAVLGSLFIDERAITRICGLLQPDDFTREDHGHIYRAALAIHDRGGTVDTGLVASELQQQSLLQQIGGRAYLAQLRELVPTAANVTHYARIVAELAWRRQVTSQTAQASDLVIPVEDLRRRLWALASAPADSELKVEKAGLAYRARCPGWELAIGPLRPAGGDLAGELTIRAGDPLDKEPLFRGQFQLGNLNARRTLAAHLRERVGLDWAPVLERFCGAVLDLERQGEPVIEVGRLPAPADPLKLLDPILTEGVPTLIFGAGGCGKSTLAAAIAVSVATGAEVVPGWKPLSAQVAILDWESGKYTWDTRIKALAAGAGVEPPEIHYLAMARPLADEVQRIAAFGAEHGIGLVIVDSVGLAGGSRAEGSDAAETTFRLFSALRVLGVASLLIDHVGGADLQAAGQISKPYGSVYKLNLARAAFELRREREPQAGEAELALFNTKAPEQEAKLPPIGLLVSYEPGRIQFRRSEVVVPELAGALPLRERMRRLLLDTGALPIARIAEETGSAADSVRSVLRKDAGQVFVRLDRGLIGVSELSAQGTQK